MTWTCPYCQQNATLISNNRKASYLHFSNSAEENLTIKSMITYCPNEECGQFTLHVLLMHSERADHSNSLEYGDDYIQRWALRPSSTAKPYPDYIPAAIIQDYNEACAIKDLSPKASATLSRRCLQGIIRDFWGLSKSRLVDEIAAIQDKVDPTTWAAIDAVRKVGNVGAHMEKDINVIIDVEPQEAQLLITLIEILFKDWYITRVERQKQLDAIVGITTRIEQAKT